MCTQTYSPLILHETCEGILSASMCATRCLPTASSSWSAPLTPNRLQASCAACFTWQKRDPKAPVTLFVNSPGGEVQSGLALYDVMRAVTCPVRTVCIGTAASMAALLFMSGSQR